MSRRRNAVVRVPESWVQATLALYAQGGGSVKLHWAELPYATPGSRIYKGLKKLYPGGQIKLKVKVGDLGPTTLGSTPYPKPGRSVTVGLRPSLKRPQETATHELRHVVQHIGDMALRATMTKKEAARAAASPKKKMSGRFGRPRPRTVKALRGWKKDVKTKGQKVSGASWYYRSPSEYLPHVGDAAAAVLRKLPADPTDAQVRARIRHVVASRPIFQHLSPHEKRDALRALYADVMTGLE